VILQTSQTFYLKQFERFSCPTSLTVPERSWSFLSFSGHKKGPKRSKMVMENAHGTFIERSCKRS
jgi:hypothetical protein